VKEEDRRKIEEIVAGMKCPRNFRCAESGFEAVCKAKDFGIESFLECFEPDPSDCPFAFPFGNRYFCHCPLRVYLAKRLRIQ